MRLTPLAGKTVVSPACSITPDIPGWVVTERFDDPACKGLAAPSAKKLVVIPPFPVGAICRNDPVPAGSVVIAVFDHLKCFGQEPPNSRQLYKIATTDTSIAVVCRGSPIPSGWQTDTLFDHTACAGLARPTRWRSARPGRRRGDL
jgi:hypothetical protein